MRAIQPKPLVDRRSTRHLVQGSWYGECGAKVSRTVRGATRSQAKHMCKGESGILLAKAMLRSKHIEIPLSLHTCDLGAEFTQCMPYNHCCTPNHTSSPHFPPPPISQGGRRSTSNIIPLAPDRRKTPWLPLQPHPQRPASAGSSMPWPTPA